MTLAKAQITSHYRANDIECYDKTKYVKSVDKLVEVAQMPMSNNSVYLIMKNANTRPFFKLWLLTVLKQGVLWDIDKIIGIVFYKDEYNILTNTDTVGELDRSIKYIRGGTSTCCCNMCGKECNIVTKYGNFLICKNCYDSIAMF